LTRSSNPARCRRTDRYYLPPLALLSFKRDEAGLFSLDIGRGGLDPEFGCVQFLGRARLFTFGLLDLLLGDDTVLSQFGGRSRACLRSPRRNDFVLAAPVRKEKLNERYCRIYGVSHKSAQSISSSFNKSVCSCCRLIVESHSVYVV